jgi:SAM-dependent methyltransferase
MNQLHPQSGSFYELDSLIVTYLSQHPDAIRLMRDARQLNFSKGISADLIETLRLACERSLDADMNRLFHPVKTEQTLAFYRQIQNFASLENKVALDFGCGVHESFAISIILWANGASHTIAIDDEAIQFPERTARFLYDWIMACMANPHKYLWPGVRKEQYLTRLSMLGLEYLKKGQLEHIFSVFPLHYLTGSGALDAISDGKVNYVFSQSVFEHLPDPGLTLQKLHKKMAPDGIVCTAIDYKDHRHYVTGASPWEYLIDDGDFKPGYINKIRHSEMMRIFRENGFVVISEAVVRDEPPVALHAELNEKYAALSKDDIESTAGYLVFRRGIPPVKGF